MITVIFITQQTGFFIKKAKLFRPAHQFNKPFGICSVRLSANLKQNADSGNSGSKKMSSATVLFLFFTNNNIKSGRRREKFIL